MSEPYNKRFPQQWQILKDIDFAGKMVLDVGCGYGDLAAAMSGTAKIVYALDKDEILIRGLAANSLTNNTLLPVHGDIDRWREDTFTDWLFSRPIDIITCFSVLPYVRDIRRTLQDFQEMAPISIIECQYAGDGPGPEWITDDNDMRQLLKDTGWRHVKKLGQTLVKGRNRYRSIWRCRNAVTRR